MVVTMSDTNGSIAAYVITFVFAIGVIVYCYVYGKKVGADTGSQTSNDDFSSAGAGDYIDDDNSEEEGNEDATVSSGEYRIVDVASTSIEVSNSTFEEIINEEDAAVLNDITLEEVSNEETTAVVLRSEDDSIVNMPLTSIELQQQIIQLAPTYPHQRHHYVERERPRTRTGDHDDNAQASVVYQQHHDQAWEQYGLQRIHLPPVQEYNSDEDVIPLAVNVSIASAIATSSSPNVPRHQQQLQKQEQQRAKPSPPVVVQSIAMDWGKQQEALDDMFDKQLQTQMQNLPNLNMPTFKGITLFEYQIQGIKWLVDKETRPKPAPFYSEVMENGRRVHFCEITQSSQQTAPELIRGSILCDSMGLGKTIQTLGLILLAPPSGVDYSIAENLDETKGAEGPCNEFVEFPKYDGSDPPTKARKAFAHFRKKTRKDVENLLGPEYRKHKEKVNRVLREHYFTSLSDEERQVWRAWSSWDKKRYAHDLSIYEITRSQATKKRKAGAPKKISHSSSANTRCTLIVCPISVISNWAQQVQDHIQPGILKLEIYHGPNRHDLLELVRNGMIDILLVPYPTLSADYGLTFGINRDPIVPVKKKMKRETIFDIIFHRIILDEAHTIRNSKSKLFRALKQVKADRKLLLTGTPFVNKTDDVYSLLAFLRMEPLANLSIFTQFITKPLKNGQEIGLTRLRSAMSCVSLRRSKKNVHTSIPMVEKNVQLVCVEFSEDSKHKQLYDALSGTLRVAMQAILGDDSLPSSPENNDENSTTCTSTTLCILERLLRLRQSCCSGVLVKSERREVALRLWKQVTSSSSTGTIKLTVEQGLELLEKLKGQLKKIEECGICLEKFDRSQVTILKRCSHVFCRTCIKQVLSRSNRKCPYCRVDFCEMDIIDMSIAQSAAAKTHIDDKDFEDPPKITALLQSIQTTMKFDEKGVIFSQFTSFLDVIQHAMEKDGHSFVRIDGSVPVRKRIDYIQQFNSDDDASPRFILGSLSACGTGINLTRGNHAFLMDCWWNEAIEEQAMDRIHRMNQTRAVRVTKFVMKGSIEESIVKLQRAKSMQAKGVLQKLNEKQKRKALLGNLRGLFQLGGDDNDSDSDDLDWSDGNVH